MFIAYIYLDNKFLFIMLKNNKSVYNFNLIIFYVFAICPHDLYTTIKLCF